MPPEKRLAHLLQTGRIPHALLLSGPKGVGIEEAALQFALQLLNSPKKTECIPDLHVYDPEGKTDMHPISAIRNLIQEVALVPLESAWKVFILHEADKMLPASSNALLKTLEEPSSHTLILLISHHPERLLPTIVSRCQTIEFPPLKKENIHPGMVAVLSRQQPLSDLKDEQPEELFATVLLWYRDRFLLEQRSLHQLLHFPEYIEQLKQTPLLPLHRVEKAVAQAKLAYERSTKLSTCLEMLMLSLAL